jgi:hypothetical protein
MHQRLATRFSLRSTLEFMSLQRVETGLIYMQLVFASHDIEDSQQFDIHAIEIRLQIDVNLRKYFVFHSFLIECDSRRRSSQT